MNDQVSRLSASSIQAAIVNAVKGSCKDEGVPTSTRKTVKKMSTLISLFAKGTSCVMVDITSFSPIQKREWDVNYC